MRCGASSQSEFGGSLQYSTHTSRQEHNGRLDYFNKHGSEKNSLLAHMPNNIDIVPSEPVDEGMQKTRSTKPDV